MAPITHVDFEAMARAFATAMGEFAASLIANAALSAALWSAAGAVACVPLLIYVWRKSLLQRRPAAWNVLAKTSYLLLFALLTLGSGSIGAVCDAQHRFHAAVAKNLQPALAAKMPLIREFIGERIGNYPPGPRSAKDLVAALVGALYYVPTSDSLWEKLKANCVNWSLRKLGTDLFVDQFQRLVIAKLEATAATLRTDVHGQAQGQLVQLGADLLVRLGTDATRQVQFDMLDKTVPQALVEVVGKAVDGYCDAAYKLIGIVAGSVSALVVAEMLVYFRWYRPRRRRVLSSGGLTPPAPGSDPN